MSMSFTHSAKPLSAQHLHFNHISNSEYYPHPPGHPSRTSSHNSSLLMMQPHHVQLHHDATRPLCQVAIFWDYESCRPAGLMPAYTIVDNIRDACLGYGSITLFKAYIERHDSSPYRPPLTHHHSHPQSQPSFHQPSLRDQLQNFGVSLSYYTSPHRSSPIPYSTSRSSYPSTTGVSGGVGPTSSLSPSVQSGISSSQLLVDMLLFALDHPAPNTVIVLITAEELSPHALSALRQRHYTIVLITPKSATDGLPLRASMAAQANFVLDWAAVMRGASTGSITAGLGTAQGTATPTAVEGTGRRENEQTDISGDVDPDNATPTGDNGNTNTLTGVMTTSPSAFSAILHPLATSPTTRHMTPAGTVSSGGTVVDAPGDSLSQGDVSTAGMVTTQDTQTSLVSGSPFFGGAGADRGQSGSRPLLPGVTKPGSNSSISSRPTSRHLSSSALVNPNPLFPASSAQNTARDPDNHDDNEGADERASENYAAHGTTGASTLNTQAAPFQPFRAHSTGLGGLASRSTHQPGSLSRVWGHFPTTSSGTTGPGLGSPLFPVRRLSSGNANATANTSGPSATRAATDTPSGALTALNTNVGAEAGPPSSTSTLSSLASPTPSSNWTQSPPLPVPLPTPQHTSVFSPLSASGIGERMRASSTVSTSPTEPLARRSSQYQQPQYPTQPQPIPNAPFTNPARGSNTGFGMGTSPANTRDNAGVPASLSHSHGQGIQSPRYMSPPPMLTFVPQRQQHQHQGSIGRFQNAQQQQQQQMAAAQQMQQALYAPPQQHHPIPRRGISSEQFIFQQQQAMLPHHAQMHTPANRDMPFGHGLHQYGAAGGMQPPARPISPRHFGLLLNILTEFRNEGKPRPYRSKIGSELVQRDRMVYQRAGVSGFKDYVGMAEQMGYVRLGGHSGSPGKEWIELVVPGPGET
ncbi:SubName: Full=Uncharacterized protein {ECO:0000313/EMBL:CCA66692.1} [Serendipita indica DSM 11827]|uniref:Uncharacterized protein n=1 Tax=Serendipita indica (strain DSM 11827) TaxID=1109443 RepID=G4T5Q6_SERID|nr:SubName: Full=Uncharacterized protein {ECO:0000313/EMBL:CCA66692.1} [Serendipita indica DSM 11827]CCA66692.1 hypothetical protein PIIN_00371 [Serendipita indica DSM 11827]